mmetsp:Transcript_40818/g.41686  ORF Transcript_40818/g.41686 Transcript_40818/m.41686 type:complete len:97 (-) Transcript_40818:75-365(-)
MSLGRSNSSSSSSSLSLSLSLSSGRTTDTISSNIIKTTAKKSLKPLHSVINPDPSEESSDVMVFKENKFADIASELEKNWTDNDYTDEVDLDSLSQ